MIAEAVDTAYTIGWAIVAWIGGGGRVLTVEAPSRATGAPQTAWEALKAPRVLRGAPGPS